MAIIHEKKISAIITGNYGVGKTTMLALGENDPRIGPLHFIDVEGSTAGALFGSPISRTVARTIDAIRAQGEWLSQSENERHFNSVVLDTGTATHITALMLTVGRFQDNWENKHKDEEKPEVNPIEDQAGQAEYLKSFNIYRELVKGLQNLPMNLFVPMHCKKMQSPISGKVVLGPLFQGKAPNFYIEMIGMVNGLWCLTQEGNTRILHLHDVAGYELKAQTSWSKLGAEIPNSMENPSITDVFDVLGYTD